MTRFAVVFLLAAVQFGCSTSAPPETPTSQAPASAVLNSWTDGPAKERIRAFVAAVCDPASADYVPQEDRRAVFDMDGTLVCEKPDYIEVVILEAFASETLASLATYWRDYVTQNEHPTLNREYARLFYKPMTDLIVYLRQAGFSVFVVSTSQQEFIRSQVGYASARHTL